MLITLALSECLAPFYDLFMCKKALFTVIMVMLAACFAGSRPLCSPMEQAVRFPDMRAQKPRSEDRYSGRTNYERSQELIDILGHRLAQETRPRPLASFARVGCLNKDGVLDGVPTVVLSYRIIYDKWSLSYVSATLLEPLTCRT